MLDENSYDFIDHADPSDPPFDSGFDEAEARELERHHEAILDEQHDSWGGEF